MDQEGAGTHSIKGTDESITRASTKPRPNRPGFIINRIDFDQASSRLQEFLRNWESYRNVATTEQLLCEVDYLVPQFAHHVEEYGYQGEGAQFAAHRRNKTTTIASVYSHGDI